MQYNVLDLETTTRPNITASRKELLAMRDVVFVCACTYATMSERPVIVENYGKEAAENAILELPPGKYYTWNGAKFDHHFILSLLEFAGYSERIKVTKKEPLEPMEFTHLIANNKIISVEYYNPFGIVEINDACLLFTCSLKNFIKNTCPEFPKLVGTYDYKKYREFEHDFTQTDKEYCIADVKGFAIGMARMNAEFYTEFSGIDIMDFKTAGSFAIKYAQSRINIEFDEDGKNISTKHFSDGSLTKNFAMGGKVHFNRKRMNMVLENCHKIDINSFYPYVMQYTKLPYGKPIKAHFSGDELKEFALKNPDTYIFAKLINGIVDYDDLYSPICTEIKGNRVFLNTAKWNDNVYMCDNIIRDEKTQFIRESPRKDTLFAVYIYSGKVGMFPYMENIYKMKNNYKANEQYALELAVKIILNSTFGKFLQNEELNVYTFKDGLIQKLMNDEGKEEMKLSKKWFSYIPVGAAITANARYIITQYQNLLGESYLYTDTDALVFQCSELKYENGIITNPGILGNNFELSRKLGAWKLEEYNKKFVVFARKTYAFCDTGDKLYKNDEFIGIGKGNAKFVFCGISSDSIFDKYPAGISMQGLVDEMKKGIDFNVLQGNRTPNGVILINRIRTKKLQEADGTIR